MLLLAFACDRPPCRGEACLDAYNRAADATLGVPFLEQGCKDGVDVACGELARTYEFGLGVPQDPTRAHALYQAVCDRGNPEGCTSVGVMMERGKIPGGTGPALELFHAACLDGSNRGCVAEAQALLTTGGDLTRAAALIQPLCAAGDPDACGLLRGIESMAGLAADQADAAARCGTDPEACAEAVVLRAQGAHGLADADAARAELTAGCDAADATACLNLGLVYSSGTLVDADPTRAADLYERACTLDASLCPNLGRLYEDGRGRPQDRARALELYLRACEAGGSFGPRGCGMAGLLLSTPGEPYDAARARVYYQRACDGSVHMACANLGDMLLEGDGGPKDLARALALETAACDAGEPYGCANAGHIYADGLGVAAQPGRARELWSRACRMGVPAACEALRAGVTPGR